MKLRKSMTLGERIRVARGGAGSTETGWVCPKCGHVWSPRTPSCFDCNRPTLEVIR